MSQLYHQVSACQSTRSSACATIQHSLDDDDASDDTASHSDSISEASFSFTVPTPAPLASGYASDCEAIGQGHLRHWTRIKKKSIKTAKWIGPPTLVRNAQSNPKTNDPDAGVWQAYLASVESRTHLVLKFEGRLTIGVWCSC